MTTPRLKSAANPASPRPRPPRSPPATASPPRPRRRRRRCPYQNHPRCRRRISRRSKQRERERRTHGVLPMKKFPKLTLALTATALLATAVLGVGTSNWTHTSETDFKGGTFDNVVATNLGDLKLSRAVRM